MDEDIKKTLMNALSQHRGDDLYRARAAFRGLSNEEMQQQYGASGTTRQQIVDGYQQHEERCNRAQEWLNAQ